MLRTISRTLEPCSRTSSRSCWRSMSLLTDLSARDCASRPFSSALCTVLISLLTESACLASSLMVSSTEDSTRLMRSRSASASDCSRSSSWIFSASRRDSFSASLLRSIDASRLAMRSASFLASSSRRSWLRDRWNSAFCFLSSASWRSLDSTSLASLRALSRRRRSRRRFSPRCISALTFSSSSRWRSPARRMAFLTFSSCPSVTSFWMDSSVSFSLRRSARRFSSLTSAWRFSLRRPAARAAAASCSVASAARPAARRAAPLP
mmetsp:Transcript_2631/g.6247  ORF Transcript_2631/g.6247 Transcript_2631/m.6247 type:complete len:265 (+) Transcript_2631:784-1578(+)